MVAFDAANGIMTLPLWAVGAAAALFLALVIIAIVAIRSVMRNTPPGSGPSSLPHYALVIVVLLLAWTFLDRAAIRDRADAHRALQARATALLAQAVGKTPALSCLDAPLSETVDAACEKAVFSSAESVASAVNYVGARLTLLAENAGQETAGQGGDDVLSDLKQASEADRFGIVAHVLTVRDRCTATACDAFRYLTENAQITAHMRDDSFGQIVARHAAGWLSAVAAASPAQSGSAQNAAEKSSTNAAASQGNWNYPSAASIPPVSIMNSEPGIPAGIAPAANSGSHNNAGNNGSEAATPSPPPAPRRQAATPPPKRSNPPAAAPSRAQTPAPPPAARAAANTPPSAPMLTPPAPLEEPPRPAQ
ncbi:MAG: hypothetical protein AB7K04_07210 [Pseudorhodoplanes sp.]